MNRKDLLEEMKQSVGVQDPVVFFQKFVDVFGLLFDRIDHLEDELQQTKVHTALAIQWEPSVAADMMLKQIAFLRQDKDTYFDQLSALKQAYAENKVNQNYTDFVKFWQDTLGYHLFLSYK